MLDSVRVWGQNTVEIHYYGDLPHTPNMVCQANDGNILVQCDITQDNEKVGSKLLKFNKQGVCLDSLPINDEAEVWAFINANPFGEGDLMASLRCEDSVVSVRVLHLDDHLAIVAQNDVILPIKWPKLWSIRFFLDKNNHLVMAMNDWQRQNYLLVRVSLDGELLDCVEATRFKQLRVTFAGTPFFHFSDSPLQYGFIAMPTQGSNTAPHLFILDSLFNVVSEQPITTINGSYVNYSNMQAVARLNDDEWLYSCRMGLQSGGEFWNQLTKFDNQLQYQADYQVHNEGTQGNTTCYPIPESSVKVTKDGAIYHACMDYLQLFPGYMNITCLNADLTVRWRHRYPKEPGFPYGLNMCVLDDGSAVVCGYSFENDVYDMFLLVFEDEGVGISEAEVAESQVEVYPNPGGSTLNIRTALQRAWVEVYDMNGRLVHRQDITENVTGIDAGGWAEGVYVWMVMRGVSARSTTLVESGKWIRE